MKIAIYLRRPAYALPAIGFLMLAGNPLAASSGETAAAPATEAMPWKLPELKRPEIRAMQDRIYRLAENQARFLLPRVRPWPADPQCSLSTESRSTEHYIRPNAAILEGFCFLYRFGPFDESRVGANRKELFENKILPMLRYLAATHVTGTRATDDGKRWGDQWQSAHWAQLMGRASWMVWADLPPELRGAARRVVAHEADRFVDRTPPHQIELDTKAEENAWNTGAVSAAIALMPDDPRRGKWEETLRRWALSSFLRSADEHSREMVDGRTVAEQFTGANLHDDFTLENHGFVHPDYMSTFNLLLTCDFDYRVTGRRPPDALFHNVRPLYENLLWFALADGGFAYPNGQDWEMYRNPAWMHIHALMAGLGRHPDAWRALNVSATIAEKMQARRADGAIYEPDEIVYRGAQEGVFRELGRVWLVLQLAGEEIVDRPAERLGVRRLDSGKIILHRTPSAVHSVSWGARIMAMATPMKMDRLISPDQRSGVGQIRLAGDNKPLPLTLDSAKVDETADGFLASLAVKHGDAVRAELKFRSQADGTWTASEKLVALKDIETEEIATGLIGILNNPRWVYSHDARRIQFDNRVVEVPALSGIILKGPSAKHIVVDGILDIASAQPLAARYLGEKTMQRGRATDRLYLNYVGQKRRSARGETIAEWEAVVRMNNCDAAK
ncbi:MAG: hypothetical protein IT426_05320 [Pirellulales bacterium]|nr:hypothetical protein [Pirellulales bacterium]